MDPEVVARLRAEVPEVERLAWDRIYSGRHTTFYDTRTHRPLPGLSEHEIIVCLIFVRCLTAEWNVRPLFTQEERNHWHRYFEEEP